MNLYIGVEFAFSTSLFQPLCLLLPDNGEFRKLANAEAKRHYRRAYRMLLSIIRPILPSLAQAWIAVLQDYALLTLPDELANQRPANGGTFYGPDANLDRVRVYFTHHWATVTRALSLWLQNELFAQATQTQPDEAQTCGKYFHLLLGMCSAFLWFLFSLIEVGSRKISVIFRFHPMSVSMSQ